MTHRVDVTIVGGGHNGLVASAYLARSGLRTLVLERLPQPGGAAVSTGSFHGFPARLSRYSYLVSLFPDSIMTDLGVTVELRSRRIASYSPIRRGQHHTGLLIERHPGTLTQDSFRSLTGSDHEYAAWQDLQADLTAAAQGLAPTLTEPLPTADEAAVRMGQERFGWLAQAPIGDAIAHRFSDDTVRGVVATDALIGTHASLFDESLVQNRCFLYHVIGNGSGEWRVPVGGMGAVTDALLDAAVSAGAQVVTGATVTGIETDGRTAQTTYDVNGAANVVDSDLVLSGVAPAVLDGLRGRPATAPPMGSQLKINLLVERLPRLRSGVDPRVAFAGTLHVEEAMSQLESAYTHSAAGMAADPMPGEIYCHSLTDDSILGMELAAQGYHTLTYFGVHAPADLFPPGDPDAAAAAADRALDALDQHLDEPIRDCLARDSEGRPCLEVKTPYDVEADLNMPGGHIFHGPLQWPWLDADAAPAQSPAERWGVATEDDNVLLCGSGARRGGAVSGIGGHNAAHAALEMLRRASGVTLPT